jgi:hypothetical protein
MNKRSASSSFSAPNPKRQDLSLSIVVDDLHDLFNEPLSPLTPPEELLDQLSSDEDLPSCKSCWQAEDGWMLSGENEYDLKGILWESM